MYCAILMFLLAQPLQGSIRPAASPKQNRKYTHVLSSTPVTGGVLEGCLLLLLFVEVCVILRVALDFTVLFLLHSPFFFFFFPDGHWINIFLNFFPSFMLLLLLVISRHIPLPFFPSLHADPSFFMSFYFIFFHFLLSLLFFSFLSKSLPTHLLCLLLVFYHFTSYFILAFSTLYCIAKKNSDFYLRPLYPAALPHIRLH